MTKSKAARLERAPTRIEDSIRELSTSLKAHASNGDPAAIRRALELLSSELSITLGGGEQLIEAAEANSHKLRLRFGETLKEEAERNGVELAYAPPHIRFGCVHLHEKAEGVWELSVLGDVVLETVRSASATVVVAAALRRIVEIESALEQQAQFIQHLKAAIDSLDPSVIGTDGVSPNLLMLLCGHGKSLRRHLVGTDTGPVTPLARAQMAFLLRGAMAAGSGVSLRRREATVNMTDPSRFMSVPRGANPRRLTEAERWVLVLSQNEQR